MLDILTNQIRAVIGISNLEHVLKRAVSRHAKLINKKIIGDKKK